LLLAYLAQDRGGFDTIWAFTRTEMLLRDDDLAVWRWDPAATPHVSDSNNATDGDLLIAYAAALAGRDWQRPDLVAVAARMAAALAEGSVEEIAGSVMLKPGNVGFGPGDRPDGPVVNPSYWVFEALPVMAALAPEGPWAQLADGGHALVVAAMKIGPSRLPPDWVSLKAGPTPADGFPGEFGYNALRIPLYLMRAGTRDRALLETFQQNMADAVGRVRLVDIKTGATRQTLDDAGYKAIPALIGCVLDKKPLPDDVKQFEPTEYYPSTLHLLALSFARRRHPECL
jgi:endoglucanase